MQNVLMPNVGSGATLQVLVTEGRTKAILAEIKNSTNSDLVKSYQQLAATSEKYLTEARQKMLDTGRAALRQEVRKVEAILASKNYTVLVSDMPEIRFLGNKKNNDLAREAKTLLQYYNTISEFFYKPTKAEIITRGIDLNSLAEQYPNNTVDMQGAEDFFNLLKQNATIMDPSLSINKIELDDKTSIDKNWIYAGVFVLVLIILKRRK